MSSGAQPTRAAKRTASLLLATCTVLALANLPARDLPAGWLVAFVLPGALLAFVLPGALLERGGRLVASTWQRALFALLLQTGACWLAFAIVGPMSRPAALACTILPPLGFATARSQPADQTLALFLGFCVMLVGTILDGLCAPLLAAYGVCACLSLRCADHFAAFAHGRVAAVRTAPARHGALGGTLPLVFGSLLAMLVMHTGLAWLPSPSRGAAPGRVEPAGAGARQIGLDDTFVLGGNSDLRGDTTSEVLVRARTLDQQPVPAGLYLRSGFFTVPGLDRWQLGAVDTAARENGTRVVLHAPRDGAPVRELELERAVAALAFVFVPPATCELTGSFDLAVDRAREWVRQRAPRDIGAYKVLWQDLAPPGPEDRVTAAAELLQVPRDLDRARYERLLREWQVPAEPTAAMARLAEQLASNCRYERAEPNGPFASAIDNFLFAPGDRRGYCMHFASAAALLLRVHGVPCRVAAGVHGGAIDRSRPNARVYGSQNAHAWVEVPFADRGWVVFDPTPPARRGHAGQRADLGAAGAAPQIPEPEPEPAPAESVSELAMRPWFVALLLALGLAASAWPRGARPPRALPEPPPVMHARRLLARLLQALAAAGEPRERGQTLERFAQALAARQRLAPAVDAAFTAYQRVRFGGRAFDDEHERALRDGLAAALAMPPTIT